MVFYDALADGQAQSASHRLSHCPVFYLVELVKYLFQFSLGYARTVSSNLQSKSTVFGQHFELYKTGLFFTKLDGI